LGRINAEGFFGGRMKLRADLAREAIETKIAQPLGLDAYQAAKGILDIVDSHMADLVRRVTIEQGYHPGDFVIYAYGGGGPLHVGSYGRDIGVSLALVSPFAPAFSAFGIAGCDIRRQYTRSHPVPFPAPAATLNTIFGELEEEARRDAAGDLVLERSLDMKFRRQVHNVRIPAPSGELGEKGTAYRKAGVELSHFVVTATVRTYKPKLKALPPQGESPDAGRVGERKVYFDGFITAPVFRMERLAPKNRIAGPAVIESPATTVLLHPDQKATVDSYLNLLIEMG
jgi:N-methylhydantoinase A